MKEKKRKEKRMGKERKKRIDEQRKHAQSHCNMTSSYLHFDVRCFEAEHLRIEVELSINDGLDALRFSEEVLFTC